MSELFWLRAETKANEFRRAITPLDAKKLIASGHKVTVEDWSDSIIKSDEYKNIGCQIVEAHTWVDAPKEAIIIGLKALPENINEFKHTHIFFAHAYKEQDGWKELLTKFQKGGGNIIDLEFMLDENQRRVCAFGYWAGYVGSALGALFTYANNAEETAQQLNNLKSFPNKDQLIEFVSKNTNNQVGHAVVIGSQGRCGTGASDALASLKWNMSGWDRAETSVGGPFKELLNFDLLVNCVLAMEITPPFINIETIRLADQIKLKTISDVSCDPDSEYNMIPLYKKATTLERPFIEIDSNIKLTAIDNLPSILPKESSEDFSSQLCPYLESFTRDSGPIKNSLDFFYKTIKSY